MTKQSKNKKGPKPAAAAEDAPALPHATGTLADVDRFRARADALTKVKPFRGADIDLAHHNLKLGLAALAPFTKTLKEALPSLDWSFLDDALPLTLATSYLVDEGSTVVRSKGEIQALLQEASKLRRLLLQSARALAEKGLVSSDAVRAIEKDSGNYDMAKDCVALAALFTKAGASIRGKTPVDARDVHEADRVGRALLSVLTPKGGRRPSGKPGSADALRDRMWTLVVAAHENLWRAGAYQFGLDVDQHVPLLLSASRPRAAKTKSPPPAPAPAAKSS